MRAIEIWEYEYEKYNELIFVFHDYWSKAIKVSKHKRICPKRIFYATKLMKRIDEKMLTPIRIKYALISVERLKEKGCLL